MYLGITEIIVLVCVSLFCGLFIKSFIWGFSTGAALKFFSPVGILWCPIKSELMVYH